MGMFRPTTRFLFLFILSFGVVTYLYISYSGLRNSQKELHQYKDSAREFTKFNLNKTAEEDRHPSNTTDEGEDTAVSDVLEKALKLSYGVDWERLEKEQSRRLATLKAYCASQPETFRSQGLLKFQLLFFEKIKTAYCFIPKTGCSTMKLLLYNLEHNTTEKPMHKVNRTSKDKKHVGINARRLRMLMDYSKEQAGLRLSTFKKIIVVRDPLERLASVWLDKFVNSEVRKSWTAKYYQELRRSTNQKPTNKSSQGTGGGKHNNTQPVSFEDFLTAVSKHTMYDVHWESFSKLCLPCEIDYDFIAHTDTLASDIRLFLKKNNVTAREDILPEHQLRRANDETVFGDVFGQVPREKIMSIRRIYQEDFDMFGYSFEEDLAKIDKARG
ncbi:PREDICTED: carbohydrate sulfotransferase 9-like isoform X1 [Branchiostoma belcheri]|uniref:Carbohydrate sulfotransferase n=1 Tax=Branchiostoma belcheri TaxID=7741 RepID=A0A6P4YRC7_BRABE|nr:PREDICTED: carbohydrate sulfotransferase 9-like isoform X1 [Branchiostoma belcheri]